MPVGAAVMLPGTPVMLFTGVAAPMSTESSAPCGCEPLTSCSAVTTARPILLLPRSGSIATASGDWSTAMAIPVRLVGGVALNRGERSISVTVLDPVLVTMAAAVESLMATPVGFVPIPWLLVTSAIASLPVIRFTIETLLLPLFATTAIPRCWLIATPMGGVPTAMVFFTAPNVALPGLMSMIKMLLHPLMLTTAIGEKGPFIS